MDPLPAFTAQTNASATVPPALEALRLSHSAGLAFFSLAANRLLEAQVRNAYGWGEFLRAQSGALIDVAHRFHDPVIAEALGFGARISEHAGDAVVEAAVEWGRRHGHLAFAVPVTACPAA